MIGQVNKSIQNSHANSKTEIDREDNTLKIYRNVPGNKRNISTSKGNFFPPEKVNRIFTGFVISSASHLGNISADTI